MEKKTKGHFSENFINIITQELEQIQQRLVLDSTDNSLWTQEKSLQNKVQHHALEQEIYWAQRAQKHCFLFGDKNAIYFKYQQLSRREEIMFGESWMNMESVMWTKMMFCRYLLISLAGDLKGIHRRFGIKLFLCLGIFFL